MKMIIDFLDDCPACKEVGGLVCKLLIDDRHIQRSEVEEGVAFSSACCADDVWEHNGLQCDGCVRITCKKCGAQAGLDLGTIYLSCTGKQEENEGSVPSWVHERSGVLLSV